ncbi:hypothetical protein QOZ80_3BG0266710 [Eleusine coracana subsp. coracana]|nr:hypothetical protein QOZ80_3BG0266710 [Eleusine coracana subsp. coracana]
MVTFWVARPPNGSYFTFCSPDLEISEVSDVPCILNTEDDLVLLRFPICRPCLNLNPRHNDYFVYQAGDKDKPPSLELIPSPPAMSCSDNQVGLLPCRTHNMYFIAILQPVLSREWLYKLYLYSSKTKTWTTKLMHLNQIVVYTIPSKVITIGGEHGSMGWVELWRGILICDVLLDNHKLRYISLPPAEIHEVSRLRGPAFRFRDIIACDGCIKLLKMYRYIGPGGVTKGWQVATYVWMDSSSSWAEDCSIKFTEDLVLPCLWDAKPIKQLTFKGDYSGYPALSLHDGDLASSWTDRIFWTKKHWLLLSI